MADKKPESLTCGCEPLSVYLVSAERCRYFAAIARINALRSEIAALQSDHQLFYAATIARERELREERDEAGECASLSDRTAMTVVNGATDLTAAIAILIADQDALLEALKELRAHNRHDHGCGHEKDKLDQLLTRLTAKGEGL